MGNDHIFYAFHATRLLVPGHRYQVVACMECNYLFFSPRWVSKSTLEVHTPSAVLQLHVEGDVSNKFINASVQADAWRRDMLKRLYQEIALTRKDTYPVVPAGILGTNQDLVQTMLHDVLSLNDGDQPLLKRDALDAALASRTKHLLREEYEAWSSAIIDAEHLDYIVDDGPRLESQARDAECMRLLRVAAYVYHRYMQDASMRDDLVAAIAHAEEAYAITYAGQRDFFTDLNSLVMEAPAKKAV